jgi:AraC family transcriptional regulator
MRVAAALAARETDEAAIGNATAQFLMRALASEPIAALPWITNVTDQLCDEMPPSTEQLAHRLDLHPAYLARAYRAVTGEGVAETQRRRRVEAASSLLRHSSEPLAEIAIAAGFCDQSHMNRCFSAVLGRTPREVRRERRLFDEQVAYSA